MQEIHRRDLAALRSTLGHLGLVIAECDEGLRYVWIDNPHPDFDPSHVIGKRDDELIPRAEAEPIMAMKRDVLTTRNRVQQTVTFERSDGVQWYSIAAFPIHGSRRVDGVLTVGFQVTPRTGRCREP